MLGRIGFGAHQHEHVRGRPALAGPDFLPVDDPCAAVSRQLCLGAHAGKVRSRSGFGIALPPDVITLDRLADKQFALFLGALFQQRRHGHVDPVAAHFARRAGTGEFFTDHLRADHVDRLFRPAITLWHRAIEIAAIDRLTAKAADEVLQLGLAAIARLPCLCQKRANILAKGFCPCAIAQIHRVAAPCTPCACAHAYAQLGQPGQISLVVRF